MPVTKHGTQTEALKLIHRLLVHRRGCVWWVDVLRINIRLLPITTSTDRHICLFLSSDILLFSEAQVRSPISIWTH